MYIYIYKYEQQAILRVTDSQASEISRSPVEGLESAYQLFAVVYFRGTLPTKKETVRKGTGGPGIFVDTTFWVPLFEVPSQFPPHQSSPLTILIPAIFRVRGACTSQSSAQVLSIAS